ncbi:MAG: methyltransferase domain-containing protein [Treponema sp.]|nr:methyltransferase domain-containing protein [Treponema sp.]
MSGKNRGEIKKLMERAREAAYRVLGERPYDEQMAGARELYRGRIVEMKTGEGKTLACVPAACCLALSGGGVHIVTANDYLAERDCAWMGPVYRELGLSAGCVLAGMDSDERRENYNRDITYGTASEMAFDYLRDNLVHDGAEKVQRGRHCCIVDEADSILLDEALTPFIIAGPGVDTGQPVRAADSMVPFFAEVPKKPDGEYPDEVFGETVTGDYKLNRKNKTVAFTAAGAAKAEKILRRLKEDISDEECAEGLGYLTQALRAHLLFMPETDYLVRDGELCILDAFTGRLLEGRRYAAGLHEALECKEGLAIAPARLTLASISTANYFRLYGKLAGMTGTAASAAKEFAALYGLKVVSIPPHKPCARVDYADSVFPTEAEKNAAVCAEIAAAHKRGRPVLAGTPSVEKSETLSALLARRGVGHRVLNAKHHREEAAIIACAGRRGAVTIATNMAGRGTDIKLGEGARETGGLYVIGTERHESRRVDDQLRGRSGRQGDPGASRFFVSLEDSLITLYGGKSASFDRAQKKAEERRYTALKMLFTFDDALAIQQERIYALRDSILEGEDLKELLRDTAPDLDRRRSLDGKERRMGTGAFNYCVRMAYLWQIDRRWALHLENLESLREGIFLRAYAEKNPLVEYMHGASDEFETMLGAVHAGALSLVLGANIFLCDFWKDHYAEQTAARKISGAHRVVSYYNALLRAHGRDSVSAVAYVSRESQRARFKALIENAVPDKTAPLTLLDLGCGLGDLCGWLAENGYTNIAYTGMDISAAMVEAAGKNYPSGIFCAGDFLDGEIPPHDIICASGSLNYVFETMENQAAHIEDLIRNAWEKARRVFAFNLLDGKARPLTGDGRCLYYADKARFLACCKTLCSAARLVDGYLDNDFTIVMKK